MEGKNFSVFLELLNKEDKDKAITFIIDLLESDTSIIDVYEKYLIPSLSNYECDEVEKEICVWKEHTRTSIIRTILEATYLHLIKVKKPKLNKSVIVLCPQEEYHEIGALIATNYFTLAGFEAKYIGANTPSDNIISAIKVFSPDYIALSVTDYYNVVVTKRLTEKIRELCPKTKIIIGGQAFNHEDSLNQVAFDYLLQTKEDIFKFAKEVVK